MRITHVEHFVDQASYQPMIRVVVEFPRNHISDLQPTVESEAYHEKWFGWEWLQELKRVRDLLKK